MSRPRILHVFPLLPFLLAAIGALPALASASTVSEVGFRDMALASELIFEGQVIATATRQGPGRLIFTDVTFEILDVIKGNAPAGSITLAFLGGSRAGHTLRVAEMNTPPSGEHGIYFVESTAGGQAHPLYGWDQGRFRVLNDPARRRALVASANGAAVVAVDAKARPVGLSLSDGIAAGVQIRQADESSAAISMERFKQVIRDALQGQ